MRPSIQPMNELKEHNIFLIERGEKQFTQNVTFSGGVGDVAPNTRE